MLEAVDVPDKPPGELLRDEEAPVLDDVASRVLSSVTDEPLSEELFDLLWISAERLALE